MSTIERKLPTVYSEFDETITVDGCEFRVCGRERDWNPMPGCEAPPGRCFEARITPGRYSACGDSLETILARAADVVRAYAEYRGMTVDRLHRDAKRLDEIAGGV